MTELIKVIKKDNQSLVSARELHEFLESAERFSKWIDRMFGYGFTENVDYTLYFFEHPQNHQKTLDYVITLDMAKEISMIQRSDKGKQARSYFIECEKKLQEVQKSQYVIPQTYADALFLAANQQLQIQEQAELLQLQAPKVEFVDKLIETKDAFTTTSIASEYGLTATKLNKILNSLKVQYYQDNQWILYAEYKAKGYTKTRTTLFNEDTRSSHLTVWTEKGRLFIHSMLKDLDYKLKI